MKLGYDVADIQQTTINGDNQFAISFITELDHHFRPKHIDVLYHYLQEHIKNICVTMKYISTKAMPIDGLTKPLTGLKLCLFYHHPWFKDSFKIPSPVHIDSIV